MELNSEDTLEKNIKDNKINIEKNEVSLLYFYTDPKDLLDYINVKVIDK